MHRALTAALLAAVAVPTLARADDAAKPPEVKSPWTAKVEAGLVFTTGNSRTTTVSGALAITYTKAKNKLSLDANVTYANASTIGVKAGVLPTKVLTSEDVERQSKTSAQAYGSKLRYDRFLSEFNSLFAAALAGADVVAGKDFVGGAQAGYSRVLYKTEQHTISGELGYDFSYEAYGDPAAKSLSIHSARGFLGYKGTVSADVGVETSLEVLGNLNRQSDDVGPMEDIRATGVASLTSKLSKSVSFAFSLTGKFDNVPAPFSLPGRMIDMNDPPQALKLDTTTKASLIVTFL